MPSSVRTFLPVIGDATALAATFDRDPERWLPAGSSDDTGRWQFTVHAGAMHRAVRASIGAPWRAGSTRWRAIAWDPVTEDRLLPSLDGELGLHLESGGRATLVLDARYRPPGGVLGAAADAVGLNRVARATVERFLEEVAAKLSAEAVLHSGGSAGNAPDHRRATVSGS